MEVVYKNSSRYVSDVNQSSYSPIHNLLNGNGNGRMVIAAVSFSTYSLYEVSSISINGNIPDGKISIISGAGFYNFVSGIPSDDSSDKFSNYASLSWWFDNNLPVSAGNIPIDIITNNIISREIVVDIMEFTGVSQTATVDTGTNFRSSSGDISSLIEVRSNNCLGVGVFSSGSVNFGIPINLKKAQAGAVTSSASGCGYNTNIMTDISYIYFGWTSIGIRGVFAGAIFRNLR